MPCELRPVTPSLPTPQTVGKRNPVDWAAVVSRQTLSADPDWGAVLPRLGALALLAIGMAWLATRAFRTYQRST